MLRISRVMSVLSVLSFFISLFGIASAFRSIDILFENRLIDRSLRSKSRAIVPFVIVVLVISLARHPFFAWASVVAFILIHHLTGNFVRHRRESNFKTEFLEFLERAILLVRTGKPFRLALSSAIEDIEPFAKQKLEKILEVVFFSQHSALNDTDSFTREAVRELIAIDRSTHRSLERLVAFRRALKLEFDFRRKAGQCLRRIRWQSYILTGLYIALFVFMLFNFRWHEIQTYALISVTFFVTGLFWIMNTGRSVKWKI
ncbi:MAG: hypothetical protein ABL958_00065 [Bdellovibrionia bacterium]